MNSQTKVLDVSQIFTNRYLLGKSLYMYLFNKIPNLVFINYTDGEKTYNAIREKFAKLITAVHTYRYMEPKKKVQEFSDTYLVFENGCMVEFYIGYCEIYHDGTQDTFVHECSIIARSFKEKQRRKRFEINLVTKGYDGIELKAMEIKKTKLDLDLFYEDDFKEIDKTIVQRLNKKNDKGIVLLHGLPGAGKTTYLRYLVGKLKKKILFVSPQVATHIMDPDFIELLIDNKDGVLVIEDAENIIMDRKISGNSSVSNLLNISDGLLADFLNIQIICTFNSSLTLVDNALMRKGRLIASYEFGKLSIEKAQRLSEHLGFKTKITTTMTIASIVNQHEKETVVKKTEVMGFRRTVELN